MTRNKQNSKNVKSCSEENVDSAFTKEDRKQLHEINDLIKTLVQEVKTLKEDLKVSNLKVKNLEIENARLKRATNLTLLKLDALQQYGRRENLRIYGVPETNNNNDDGEDVVLRIAKFLQIDLQGMDIQRAHRLGKKTKNIERKPRPVIARFASFKKRNEILFAKSKLKNSAEFQNVFISEDLTPLRFKLLQYVKKENNNNFVLCHTINGNIRMKKSAKKAGLIQEHEKDEGTGSWLNVSCPDDLFKYNVDIDFVKLNYKPLLFNCDTINSPCDSNNNGFFISE